MTSIVKDGLSTAFPYALKTMASHKEDDVEDVDEDELELAELADDGVDAEDDDFDDVEDDDDDLLLDDITCVERLDGVAEDGLDGLDKLEADIVLWDVTLTDVVLMELALTVDVLLDVELVWLEDEHGPHPISSASQVDSSHHSPDGSGSSNASCAANHNQNGSPAAEDMTQ